MQRHMSPTRHHECSTSRVYFQMFRRDAKRRARQGDPPPRPVNHAEPAPEPKQPQPKPVKAPKQPKPQPDVGGFVLNRHRQRADGLRDSLLGAHCFLVCGGPSLNDQNLSLLGRRGILTAAVNQSGATHVRPHFWFSVDDSKSFHQAIWEDPAVMKFSKLQYETGTYRVWDESIKATKHGKWRSSKVKIHKLPNVWFYKHCDLFDKDRFLVQEKPTWCTHKKGGTSRRSVMLVALRLLYWLGIRTVYLLGCDFRMEAGERTYAFDQPKGPGSAQSNNRTYQMLNEAFLRLLPHFAEYGFRVYNCTPGGNLHAFPRLEYEEAVRAATEKIPKRVYVRGLYR